MNAEIKQKWIAALRSGEYEQGHRQLAVARKAEQPYLYCCLGVLCEVMNYHPNPSEFEAYLPTTIAGEAEVGSQDEETLVRLNDRERKTFSEIAEWIEANL